MLATKAALASGAITHCCLRWGLRRFFSVSAPDRVVAGALDDLQFDDFLLQKTQGPFGVARQGRPASQSDQLGFRGAVENPARDGMGFDWRVKTASKPSSTSRRRVRSIVAMLVSRASAIRLSLHPSTVKNSSRGCEGRFLDGRGGEVSVGRPATYDNAKAERFMRTLKEEE